MTARRSSTGEALIGLRDAGLPHLVGGAFALRHYAGIERHTKDLDVFVRRADQRVLDRYGPTSCCTATRTTDRSEGARAAAPLPTT